MKLNQEKKVMRKGFPEILYEDNHIIIVNKRSSDLVQGDGSGDEPLDDITGLTGL